MDSLGPFIRLLWQLVAALFCLFFFSFGEKKAPNESGKDF